MEAVVAMLKPWAHNARSLHITRVTCRHVEKHHWFLLLLRYSVSAFEVQFRKTSTIIISHSSAGVSQ